MYELEKVSSRWCITLHDNNDEYWIGIEKTCTCGTERIPHLPNQTKEKKKTSEKYENSQCIRQNAKAIVFDEFEGLDEWSNQLYSNVFQNRKIKDAYVAEELMEL